MDDNRPENSRLKAFEASLDPNVSKFAPKVIAEQTVASVTQTIREQAKLILKLCDEADQAIAASEEHARAAADHLMDMIKRVK